MVRAAPVGSDGSHISHVLGNLGIEHGNLLIEKVDLRQVLRDEKAMVLAHDPVEGLH